MFIEFILFYFSIEQSMAEDTDTSKVSQFYCFYSYEKSLNLLRICV